ncbi:hypothetical protein BN134_1456 [Cronobacter dublinensis 1210]|uniref:Uncharacterized protein n=1 Tax=Cronobacter dublinensis 1210 TaxID=1208656 RepID=A0ABP1W837_9ENTR|nr:hypothetical protein BN134_1456 [Cronobacter dublinensis 1210]
MAVFCLWLLSHKKPYPGSVWLRLQSIPVAVMLPRRIFHFSAATGQFATFKQHAAQIALDPLRRLCCDPASINR